MMGRQDWVDMNSLGGTDGDFIHPSYRERFTAAEAALVAARAEVASLTEERDRLKEALSWIRDMPAAAMRGPGKFSDTFRRVATKALAAGLPPTPGTVRAES